jgi:hypothetical protein
MVRFRTAVLLLAGVVALPSLVAAQKAPDVADVLRAAADYVATYAARVSGLSLEEDYTLLDVSGDRVTNTRRIASDVVLLNLDGRVIALRDAFSVDSNPLRERTPRIVSLLAKPSQAAWDQAQAHTAEAARYFEDELVLRANAPTLALQFIVAANQAKVTYKIDGRKRLDGVETVGLRFQETKTREADYIITTRGKALGSGRLWVDPASGCIHRTELALQSSSEFARVAVDYAHDQALDLWLPKSMVDAYEITETTGPGMSTAGASANVARRSLDCRASYSNPRLTPIDLTVSVPK